MSTEFGVILHHGSDAIGETECPPDNSDETVDAPTYLTVYSDRDELIGGKLVLSVRSTLEDDRTWYNITEVTIKYHEPPCRLTEQDLQAAGSEGLEMAIEVTIGLGQEILSLSSIIT